MNIDWTALGTWAAVVVALGISLRDTWERKKERSARHLLTAARIFPDVGRLHDALATTLEETDFHSTYASIEKLDEARNTYAALLRGMSLNHLKGLTDQPGALPEEMLIPLVKAIKVSDMMLENEAIQLAAGGPRTRSTTIEDFEWWREQIVSIKTSLDWVVLGAKRQLKSRRWSRPDLWG